LHGVRSGKVQQILDRIERPDQQVFTVFREVGVNMLQRKCSVLFAIALATTALPDGAAAGGGFFVEPGVGGVAYTPGYGFLQSYVHPFDDGYDYPFGYGEYAEYGPWVYRGYGGDCYRATRRVRTSQGWRLRTIRICE
jgi:hypothetical protein